MCKRIVGNLLLLDVAGAGVADLMSNGPGKLLA